LTRRPSSGAHSHAQRPGRPGPADLGRLFKTELIRRRGLWRGLDHVELATLEWVDWFNNRRLHSACSDVPPVEYEQQHYRQIAAPETLETAEPSLH
jgi:putative transposase